MLMQFRGRRFVDRQRQGHVPERARTHKLIAIVTDLPIETGQRVGKPRVGRRPRHDNPARRIDLDPGQKLLEMDIQILGNCASDVTLEQQRQGYPGQGQRDDKSRRAAGHEPQPERIPGHPTWSGTRYPKPRRVSIRLGPSFLRTRPISTSMALESCASSWP